MFICFGCKHLCEKSHMKKYPGITTPVTFSMCFQWRHSTGSPYPNDTSRKLMYFIFTVVNSNPEPKPYQDPLGTPHDQPTSNRISDGVAEEKEDRMLVVKNLIRLSFYNRKCFIENDKIFFNTVNNEQNSRYFSTCIC